ncbi:unnamed protein product [Miscanthus lutarioriparius]|uniref:Uncharacterized protein n=1 Tax=Miscanthus lutarioriparius TaxID=422564 RepID=A0A811RYC7_9POAL|nr:unnamed protein product [Miscanthus lutarioriparius]
MSPREWIHDVGNGPFIGVMIFIVAITAGSVLFAKYCVGDKAFMRTGYDFEGYVMRKCPVCVGLPKRTHPHVMEVGPLEIEIGVVTVEGASEPPARPAAASSAPPPSAATPAPPPPAVAVAVPVAAKEEGGGR